MPANLVRSRRVEPSAERRVSSYLAPSRAPLAGAVIGIAALFAGAEVVRGRRHGDGQAQGQVVADVPDVVNGAPGHPHDVVPGRVDDDAARQLPFESSGEDDPPFVELPVPVRTIAAPGRARDQGDELSFVRDDPSGPGR